MTTRDTVLIVAFILIAHAFIALVAMCACFFSMEVPFGRLRCDNDYRLIEMAGLAFSLACAGCFSLLRIRA
jgi:hypothetical protein